MKICNECGGVGGLHYHNCSQYVEPQDAVLITHQKILEPTKIGLTIRQNLSHTEEFDVDHNEIIHIFESSLLREHLATDHYQGDTAYQWPATTWQMFKATHADSWWLGWLVRRHPVRMRKETRMVVIRVDRYAAYPEADVPLKDLGRPFPYEELKRL